MPLCTNCNPQIPLHCPIQTHDGSNAKFSTIALASNRAHALGHWTHVPVRRIVLVYYILCHKIFLYVPKMLICCLEENKDNYQYYYCQLRQNGSQCSTRNLELIYSIFNLSTSTYKCHIYQFSPTLHWEVLEHGRVLDTNVLMHTVIFLS